jgi:hypothetical protein
VVELRIRFNPATREVAVNGPLATRDQRDRCLEALAAAMGAVVTHKPTDGGGVELAIARALPAGFKLPHN